MIRYIVRRIVFWFALSAAFGAVAHAGLMDSLLSHVHNPFLGSQGAQASAAQALPRGNTSVQAGFSPGNAESLVVRAIEHAHRSVHVAAYSFTSRPIARALLDAHKRGVDVQVVMDKTESAQRYSSATFLANSGIPVRIDSRYAIMHNKFLVIDGETLETGSFNYTYSAAHRNAENVLIIRGDRQLAATYDREWHRLWNESTGYAARY